MAIIKTRGTPARPEAQEQDPAAIKAALSVVTDELNEALQRAENALLGLGLGVRASVEIERTDNPGGPTWFRLLTFGKLDRQWRLIYESGFDDPELEQWNEGLLLNASREVRIEASRLLPKLYEELLRTAMKQVADVDEATRTVDAFVSTLASKRSTP